MTLRIGLAVGDELLEPVFVDGGEAARQALFSERPRSSVSLPGARIPNGLFPAGSVPEAAGMKSAKCCERVSARAGELISRRLHKADAIAACKAMILAQRSEQMRLDDCADVRLNCASWANQLRSKRIRRGARRRRRRRVGARPPAQRGDASVLQERHQRHRHRRDHRRSRHREDHALQIVRLEDQPRPCRAGERGQAVARMVHRRDRGRRRRRRRPS